MAMAELYPVGVVMTEEDWSLETCIDRGCLPTGEAVEALYGTGWWTREPDNPYLPSIVQCHVCGGQAYGLGEQIDCENCGKIAAAAKKREES